jgi:hypothetical protein
MDTPKKKRGRPRKTPIID